MLRAGFTGEPKEWAIPLGCLARVFLTCCFPARLNVGTRTVLLGIKK